jgi:PPM family protein phosphatase
MAANKTDNFPVQSNVDSASSDDPAAGKTDTQEVGWSIDKGLVRERNEDSLAAVTLSQASDTETKSIGVYAVADGMGGHEAGEVASELAMRTAIRKVVEEVTEADEPMPESYEHWLKSAVAVANKIVHNQANEAHKSMGTTLVMAVVVGHDVHIVNVGDSRAYLISPSGVRQITHDHSFVQLLVDSGAITPEQAVDHPRRNILTQSVGSQEDVTVDLFNERLGDDEWLLLCSDGLWGMLSDEEIGRIVRNAKSPSEACRALVEATNAAGGYDNIAAVLVRPGASSAYEAGNADDDTLVDRPIDKQSKPSK